jgi:hypothetical protein
MGIGRVNETNCTNSKVWNYCIWIHRLQGKTYDSNIFANVNLFEIDLDPQPVDRAGLFANNGFSPKNLMEVYSSLLQILTQLFTILAWKKIEINLSEVNHKNKKVPTAI